MPPVPRFYSDFPGPSTCSAFCTFSLIKPLKRPPSSSVSVDHPLPVSLINRRVPLSRPHTCEHLRPNIRPPSCSSSLSPPPSLPRPAPSVLSQHRSRRCLVLLGQPWCILAARGNSHGDGSSERAVRAAGESGDGHDGPQLHPALSAGSPKGSWALAPRACPETLPQPRCPCAAHNPDPLQPTRP